MSDLDDRIRQKMDAIETVVGPKPPVEGGECACFDCKTVQARIRELEEQLDNERARGIHSCHDHCQRPLCVANRRIRELEAENERQRETIKELANACDLDKLKQGECP